MNEFFNVTQSIIQRKDIWTLFFVITTTLILSGLIKYLINSIAMRLKSAVSKTNSIWDDMLVDLMLNLKKSVLFFWIGYLLLEFLDMSMSLHRPLQVAVVILTSYQFAIWGIHIVQVWRRHKLQKIIDDNMSAAPAIGLLYISIQCILIIIVILVGLANLGVDIGALIAGLGIGGVAIALAAQNILGDLLASLSIVLDKPFVVGDFIVVGNDSGTVEHIGIKTTRVRVLTGEELVFSNKDLLDSRIQNFKKVWRRRVEQKFGVVTSTSPDVIEKIPKWIKEFVDKRKGLTLDRCHFSQFGEYSLDFEVVFWVEGNDFIPYMDQKQLLLLDIMRKFAEEKIEFSSPTQIVYLKQ